MVLPARTVPICEVCGVSGIAKGCNELCGQSGTTQWNGKRPGEDPGTEIEFSDREPFVL